ncbi:SCO family protein [Spongiimicrobium salis]|uniref:SCO family protein n=1 Tax=Spongiimicrobium salis TaxID=1667022 RepID=UPI00374D93C3
MKNILFIILFTLSYSCHEKKNVTEVVAVHNGELPYFNTPDFTPTWTKGDHKIPEFSLINQNGDTITNQNYKGKIYIANFFFTICPSICPRLTESMFTLQEKYGKDDDIQLISHSVMPWYDNVEVLAEYAENNGILEKKWNIVTGPQEAIYELARNGYFADEDFVKTSKESNFIHTENFILVDKEGYIRGVYNGTLPIDMKRLSRHIKILKNQYQM